MNKKKLCSFLIVIMLLSCMTGCGNGKNGGPELKAPAAETLQGMPAEKGDIENRLLISGVLTGNSTSYHYKESKEDLEYKVEPGEKVTKGQALVVAGGDELEGTLENLNWELETAKAELAYKQSYGALNQELLNLNLQYAKETEKSLAENERKRAEVSQGYEEQMLSIQIGNLEREIRDIKEKIQKNTLYADSDGYVSFVSYTSNVTAYYNVVVVTDTDSLYVSLEKDLNEKQAEEYIRAYTVQNGEEIELTEIPYTEAEKKAAEKSNLVLNPRFGFLGHNWEIGDHIPVYIVLEEAKNVISVPRSCFYQSDNGQYVYRINGESKEKCFVETGIKNEARIQILSGIEEGDLVYYPVDATIKYEGTRTVEKGSISLKQMTGKSGRYYPSMRPIRTGTGEAELIYITDQTQVQKGDVIARLRVSTGTADVQEMENQLNALDRQYAVQSGMHEETVNLLSEEIRILQSGEDKTADKDSGKKKQKDVQETSKKQTSEEQEETPDLETPDEQTDSETPSDEEQEKPEEESKYPVPVQIKQKELALQMERLTQEYDAGIYNRQRQQQEKNLKTLREKTGEVTITAPEEGEFVNFSAWMNPGAIIAENLELGEIRRNTISYFQIANEDNDLSYGNSVTVEDSQGNRYSGRVIGAYNSGSMSFEESGDGYSYIHISEPDESQTSAYIEFPEEIEQDSVTITYQSNAIRNVIVIDNDILKNDNGNHFVWILRDGKPCRQYVEYMVAADKKLWITEGLTEGDTLLTGVK